MAGCFLGELHAGGQAEFGVDVGEVGLHGARRDEKPCGDVTVGQSLADQADDVALGGGERCPAAGGSFAFVTAAPAGGALIPESGVLRSWKALRSTGGVETYQAQPFSASCAIGSGKHHRTRTPSALVVLSRTVPGRQTKEPSYALALPGPANRFKRVRDGVVIVHGLAFGAQLM